MTTSYESRKKGRRLLRIARGHKVLTGLLRRRLERREKQLSGELAGVRELLNSNGKEEV